MKLKTLILTFLLSYMTAYSLDTNYYKIEINDNVKIENSVLKIAGNEWEILDFVTGDLNADKRKDLLVILNNTVNMDDGRKIILFINSSKDSFIIGGTNQHIIDCERCGGGGSGDPYRKAVIKNGYFSIEQLYGACDKAYIITTFKYDSMRQNWYLHKETIENYSCIQESADNEVRSTITEDKKGFYKKLSFNNY